jgi:invasion protein IalB
VVKLTSMIRICSAGLLAATVAGTALAQQQQPPANPKQFGPRVNQGGAAPAGPAPELVAENGNWKVQCETRPAGKDENGKDVPELRACAMVQVSRDEARPQVALSLIMRYQKQGDKSATMMQIMAPIGVFLPTGVALEIDGQAVGRVPFVRCLPQTRVSPPLCTATAEAQAATLEKMKKGSEANFIIYEAPGKSIKLPISLNGFTASYKALVDNS